MIRPIMRNQLFLAMPSEAATIEDAPVGQDLLDTLEAHAHECKIRVSYQDESFKTCQKSFSGFTAQIIQHEIDHCEGIII